MNKVYAIGIFYARAFFILERGLGKTAYSSAKRAKTQKPIFIMQSFQKFASWFHFSHCGKTTFPARRGKRRGYGRLRNSPDDFVGIDSVAGFCAGLRVGTLAYLRNVLQPVQQGGQQGLSAVCRGIQIIRNQYFP